MRRLLVVEDDPQIADFVVRGLREEGLLVEHARDGYAGCRGGAFNDLKGEAPEANDDGYRRWFAKHTSRPRVALHSREVYLVAVGIVSHGRRFSGLGTGHQFAFLG